MISPSDMALAVVVKDVLGKLLGKTAEDFGDSLAMLSLPLRMKIEHKVLRQVQEYARKHNLTLKPLPLKDLSSAVANASLEEDPQLQELWARLIANASSDQPSASVVMFASEFLRSISYQEAQVVKGALGATLTKLHPAVSDVVSEGA